jgi:hypothetical protein
VPSDQRSLIEAPLASTSGVQRHGHEQLRQRNAARSDAAGADSLRDERRQHSRRCWVAAVLERVDQLIDRKPVRERPDHRADVSEA